MREQNKYKGYFRNKIPYVDINAILNFIYETGVKNKLSFINKDSYID
jgi:hypothetical protein